MSLSLSGDLCPRGSFYIKFYPELQRYFGSRNVPLIIGRLEFWFSNPKFKNGFFKFLEPCRHYLYKEGDSWSEELGVSRILFNKAFDLIGIRYKSKADFLQAKDPFQGKLYASYYHRKTNKTFYVRNHYFVDDFFQSLFPKKTVQKIIQKRNGEGNLTSIQKTTTQPPTSVTTQTPKTTEENTLKNCSRNVKNDCSLYKNKKNTNILLSNVKQSKKEPNSKPIHAIEEDMIHIWREETGAIDNTPCSITKISALKTIFQDRFNSSLDNWRQYCRIIGSSRFLTGKVTSFRAWISWAIKPDSIDRIRGGEFSVWDQTPPMLIKTKQQNEENYKNRLCEHKRLEKEKENLQTVIGTIQRNRFIQAESFFDRLPDSVRQVIQKTYAEKQFIDPKDIVTKMFHRNGWTGIPKYMLVRDYAADNEKVIFALSEEEEIERYVQENNLLDAYKSMMGEGGR